MKPVRALIVDDENLARRRIRNLLAPRSEVEVVAETATAAETIQAIREHAPDLVFLDVQLPDESGFEVLRALAPAEMPAVIFVTAYDRFAVDAFEVHALDYLLKPFDDERFGAALDRALDHLRRPAGDPLRAALRQLLGAAEVEGPRRLVVRSAGRIVFVEVEDIEWVEAQGSYVRIHTAGDSHLLRQSMKDLERLLPTGRFSRIHRSRLVRLDRVKEVRHRRDGTCRVVLRGGLELAVSDGRRADLFRQLGLEVGPGDG